MNLAGLLRPRSIALVGASDKSRWARMALRNIEGSGYTGALHIVNRRGGEVLGRPASISCTAIGEPVDVALLLVPAAAIPSTLDDLAAAGVRNAVLLSSGFAEAGEDGKRMQEALAMQAAAAGITILGPNCLGYYNFAGKAAIWTGTLPAGYPVGRIGIVSQSGAVANAIAHFCYQQGIGLSSMVSTGNEATLGIAPIIDDLLNDENTDVVGIFMEAARDPAGFRATAARAQRLGKPLVVLKVGRSEVTAKAAQAHTGALVGDDRVFDALCRQYGVVRVRSIEELAVTADVLARTGVLPGEAVGLVSISGGLSEISADLASDAGIRLAAFSPATTAALQTALPAFATVHNPLDLTGAATEDTTLMRQAIAAIGNDPAVSLLTYIFEVPYAPHDTTAFAMPALQQIGEGVAQSRAPVLVLAGALKPVSESARQLIAENRLPYVSGGLELGMPAIGRALWWSARQREGRFPPAPPAAPASAAPLPQGEHAAKAFLAGRGVPVVPTVLARTPGEAARAAAGMGGAVALKIASPDIAHKTEVGGVALDVPASEAEAACVQMLATVRDRCPTASLDGVLVSPMRRGGVELLVGVTRDRNWGLVLTVGLGGVLVEMLRDSSQRLLPVDEAEVTAMLGELRGAKLLAGYRGAPAVHLPRLAQVITRIAAAAEALGPSLAALEVNPLLCAGDRIEALDALVLGQ